MKDEAKLKYWTNEIYRARKRKQIHFFTTDKDIPGKERYEERVSCCPERRLSAHFRTKRHIRIFVEERRPWEWTLFAPSIREYEKRNIVVFPVNPCDVGIPTDYSYPAIMNELGGVYHVLSFTDHFFSSRERYLMLVKPLNAISCYYGYQQLMDVKKTNIDLIAEIQRVKEAFPEEVTTELVNKVRRWIRTDDVERTARDSFRIGKYHFKVISIYHKQPYFDLTRLNLEEFTHLILCTVIGKARGRLLMWTKCLQRSYVKFMLSSGVTRISSKTSFLTVLDTPRIKQWILMPPFEVLIVTLFLSQIQAMNFKWPHPRRVQRKHLLDPLPANTKYVGRPSRWGNPYSLKEYSRKESLILYEMWLINQLRIYNHFLDPLKGKKLACFCKKDEPCHADILLHYIDNLENIRKIIDDDVI